MIIIFIVLKGTTFKIAIVMPLLDRTNGLKPVKLHYVLTEFREIYYTRSIKLNIDCNNKAAEEVGKSFPCHIN
jgi:hypothetical protein